MNKLLLLPLLAVGFAPVAPAQASLNCMFNGGGHYQNCMQSSRSAHYQNCQTNRRLISFRHNCSNYADRMQGKPLVR